MDLERFYGHVKRTSNEVAFLDWLAILGDDWEAEIAEFKSSMIDEDIGWFNISMNNIEAS